MKSMMAAADYQRFKVIKQTKQWEMGIGSECLTLELSWSFVVLKNAFLFSL
jgi:hypothetical protein